MNEKKRTDQEEILNAIKTLVMNIEPSAEGFELDLVAEIIQTAIRLIREKHTIWQLKLINRALKEMRYAYGVFNQYPANKCISIFGSARTPEDYPDYHIAKDFSKQMADMGWMCITGAANGIMKAVTEGAQVESSFGLSIRLPFEIPTNVLLEGDPKLMIFRYFFTRKLMFIGHADAIAACPGGFGTMDELFEVLTLIQTGKASIVPLVLIEGATGHYWKDWEHYVRVELLGNGWISEEDLNLYFIADSAEQAKEHILQFYRRYHSSRYVKELLVIRMQSPLTPEQIEMLNKNFGLLVQAGKIYQTEALPEESEYKELPRLIFHHTRQNFGLLRALINQINAF